MFNLPLVSQCFHNVEIVELWPEGLFLILEFLYIMRLLKDWNSLLLFGRMQEYEYSILCKKFELEDKEALTSINIFSHKVEFK